MHNLKLVMRKQSDKPETEGQSINQLTVNLQKCQCTDRRSLRSLVYDPELDHGSEKNYCRGHHCYIGQPSEI